MTLEQLRVFVAVAEREHVTEAARALNLTQSATSAAVAALEERHDVRLFDRVGRRVELTATGRAFLPEARAVLARAEEAAALLAEATGLKRGTLKLAASQTVANYWLPTVMQRFHERYPGIALTLAIANTRSVGQAVLAGTADLGFVEDDIREPSLDLVRVAEDRLVLVAAFGHEAGNGGNAFTAGELMALRWVLREPGSGTRAIAETALRRAGVDPAGLDVALELPSNEAVRAAVEAGAGVAALSGLVVEPSLRAGRLAALPFALPGRGFHAVTHRERHLGRAAKAFLETIG